MSAYVDKGVGGVPNRTNIAYVLFVLTNQQQVFLLEKLKLGETLQKKELKLIHSIEDFSSHQST